MKNVLLKSMVLTAAGLAMAASNALANPIFFEADNVTGRAEITYGMGNTINDAPVLFFQGIDGYLTSDITSFVAGGDYTVTVTLEGFAADINENGNYDYNLGYQTYTSATYAIPALPIGPNSQGTYGPFTWNLDWVQKNGTVSYDFDLIPGPTTNQGVNGQLAGLDNLYGGGANGVMNANVKWDTLRIELNPVPNSVPEPTTMLLFGTGLAGLFGVVRRKRK